MSFSVDRVPRLRDRATFNLPKAFGAIIWHRAAERSIHLVPARRWVVDSVRSWAKNPALRASPPVAVSEPVTKTRHSSSSTFHHGRERLRRDTGFLCAPNHSLRQQIRNEGRTVPSRSGGTAASRAGRRQRSAHPFHPRRGRVRVRVRLRVLRLSLGRSRSIAGSVAD